jgi:predicted nuclease of predicted toxin-antitoxin system
MLIPWKRWRERIPLRYQSSVADYVHPDAARYAREPLGEAATDTELWEYARIRDLAIVSKDADFSERIVTTTPPPRVVHLRFGNLRRREFHQFLARIWPRIEYLTASHKLVNVYLDRLEAVN